jgi:quercetin dioxygenase-like cupin family protein
MPDDNGPTFVPPRGGTVLDFLAVTHRLTSRDTGGACYLFESTFEPGTGNRMHIHRREDEIGYVLEGALEVRLAGRSERLEAGGIARLPKGIAHAIRNPLGTTSRYLFIVVPGGLDLFFDALDRARGSGDLDDALYQQLSREHGIDWVE